MFIPKVIGSGVLGEIGLAIAICLEAREKALKLQKEYNSRLAPGKKRRTDKWTHAYVGCVLRRKHISPWVALLMAYGKEVLDAAEDFFIGDADSTPKDAEATMNGYWNAYLGSKVVKEHIGCGIVTYKRISIPSCARVCDLLYIYKRGIKIDRRGEPPYTIKQCFYIMVPIERKLIIMIYPPPNPFPGLQEKKYKKVWVCITVAENVYDWNEYRESILKNTARELVKFDKEKAEKLLENLKIDSEPAQDDEHLTKEIKKFNKEIYNQIATELKKKGIQRITEVNFILNSNKKEIHNLKKISHLCNLNLLKNKHRLYVRNKKFALRAMAQGFDGCKHCMAKYHIK